MISRAGCSVVENLSAERITRAFRYRSCTLLLFGLLLGGGLRFGFLLLCRGFGHDGGNDPDLQFGIDLAQALNFGVELVIRGTMERAMPIFATAIAITLAFVPFLLYRGHPGLEIVAPMALVVIPGLLSFVLFAIFVVPTLYLALGAHAVAEADFEELQEHSLYV